MSYGHNRNANALHVCKLARRRRWAWVYAASEYLAEKIPYRMIFFSACFTWRKSWLGKWSMVRLGRRIWEKREARQKVTFIHHRHDPACTRTRVRLRTCIPRGAAPSQAFWQDSAWNPHLRQARLKVISKI